MAIKLTKNEQKVQKDHLKEYQRYLPTLQLYSQRTRCLIPINSWTLWYSRTR